MGTRSLRTGQVAVSSLPLPPEGIIEPIELEVISDKPIPAAASEVGSKYSRLDVLINNAVIGPSFKPPAEAPTRERFTKILSTNVTGAACPTDAIIPHLPSIIFVSSAVGNLTQMLDASSTHYGINAAAYKASKPGMNMLMAM